jgi:hypothetical protein
MSIVITDTALVQKLVQASGTMEVRDANGNFLGTFAPSFGKSPPGVRSPFTEEEMERRRSQPDGRSLAEILRDLEARG